MNLHNFSKQSRRDLLKQLGLSAISCPILTQTSLFGNSTTNPKQRLIIVFTPNGTIPEEFWPEKDGTDFEHKSILKPLEPFHDKMLVLKKLHNRVRGDGDNHMRGMSCLLTGIELFPGNIQGGGNTPAGWPKGISIDREITNFLQSNESTKTRFGALHYGVGVSDVADPWTRMSYAGANLPVAPISDPYEVYKKLYGNGLEQKKVLSVLDEVKMDIAKISEQLPESERKLLIEHAKLVDKMDKDFANTNNNKLFVKPPALKEGVRNQNDHLPELSRMQIDLLVNAFVNDFARVSTLQFTKSVGQAKMNWLDIDDNHHTLSHEPDKNKDAYDKLTRINVWFAQEIAYLAKKLENTPEPNNPKQNMLDNTLIVWTNELGKGNSHTLNNIPFVCIGNGLNFQMGRSVSCDAPHNRFLMNLAHAFNHKISTFGNPKLSELGCLEI